MSWALLVCHPLAVTSSKCDDLLSALNTKSLRYVAYTWSARDEEAVTRSHRDTHLRLQALQQGLRQLNYDQVRRKHCIGLASVPIIPALCLTSAVRRAWAFALR